MNKDFRVFLVFLQTLVEAETETQTSPSSFYRKKVGFTFQKRVVSSLTQYYSFAGSFHPIFIMSSRAATIILNHVCPIIGIVFANYMFLAPLKDLDTAVKNAQGLNGLNPTPWAFMLGNCLGWTAYALLSKDYYLFLADAPGFLIACWLNLGAIKLMYSAHHQKETRKSLVAFLQKNEIKMEEEIRKSMFQQPPASYYDSNSDDDEDDKKSKDDEEDVIPGYDDDEEKKDVEVSESQMEESKDAITPLQTSSTSSQRPASNSTPSLGLWVASANNSKSSVGWGKQKSTVRFGKQKSDVSFCIDEIDEEKSERFGAAGEEKEESASGGEKSMSLSAAFHKSKSRFGLFSQKSKKLANMHKSLAEMATSFAKRKEKMNEWGEVVWQVTSQQHPAKAPHEKLVMGLITLWFVTLCILGFYAHYDKSEDGNRIPLLVIGYVVLFNQIFFYGAPLSRINMVIRTKKCDSIHFQSLVANTLNSGLWLAYGIAPQISDPFIWGPCALGLVFAVIQFVCCAIFPRTKISDDEVMRFSITSMLVSQSQLGYRRSSIDEKSIQHTAEMMDSVNEEAVGDLEANNKPEEQIVEEYMTSYGHYSYLF